MTYHGHNEAAHKLDASHFDAPQLFHGGRILDPGNSPRSYTQPSYRRAPMLRCSICQRPFERGERTVIVADERTCVPCARDFHDPASGEETA